MENFPSTARRQEKKAQQERERRQRLSELFGELHITLTREGVPIEPSATQMEILSAAIDLFNNRIPALKRARSGDEEDHDVDSVRPLRSLWASVVERHS